MEQALGKLVMDVRFRDAFFRDPTSASLAVGIQLTDRERSALGCIRPGALAAFQRYLDRKRIGNWIEEVSALLLEIGRIEPIRRYDEEYLSIRTPDVLARIEVGDEPWEAMVPAVVADTIRTKRLFGYHSLWTSRSPV
jgi:hypothetical protein